MSLPEIASRDEWLAARDGCPSCSAGADEVSQVLLDHLHARDTTLAYVSRASLAKIEDYKARKGGAEGPGERGARGETGLRGVGASVPVRARPSTGGCRRTRDRRAPGRR